MCSRSSAMIPSPVSETAICTRSAPAESRIETTPPSGVELIALRTTLVSTWAGRSGPPPPCRPLGDPGQVRRETPPHATDEIQDLQRHRQARHRDQAWEDEKPDLGRKGTAVQQAEDWIHDPDDRRPCQRDCDAGGEDAKGQLDQEVGDRSPGGRLA